MIKKMIWNDIAGNKTVTITITLFIAISAMLLSLGGVLTVNLLGAIDTLMEEAKTPHFMQMHSGELDLEELASFAADNKNTAEFQVMEFLNVDNSQIILGDTSLSGNLQDNGLIVQSEAFDFLLDLDNNKVWPKAGEIYVPVCYLKDGTAKAGDKAVVNGSPFTIAGFVRDSQMNSSLASSKRFLVSREDYDKLEASGTVEYLIEFRLYDLSGLGRFESDYKTAGLPANGPALTWPLFRMISAVSDGLMIGVVVLVSILVILIGLLCIRFTLLAKIEDDYREIGVMKAIGMRVGDIRKTYLLTYGVMGAAGSILGLFLSFLFYRPMTESIRRNLGEGGSPVFGLLLGMAGAFLAFVFILFYVYRILGRFGKISAVQAIRSGGSQEGAVKVNTFVLSQNRLFSANFYLGVKDVSARKRLYATMLLVIVLSSFIMIVPQNVYTAISHKNFITYMGVGNCDLRLDIQQVDGIEGKAEEIAEYMENDSNIDKYTVLTTKIFPIRLETGMVENIKVELGNHGVFPLQYLEGSYPRTENEIALSSINGKELEKKVGDTITIMTGEGDRQLAVCGIYSDITNGGKTAKGVFRAEDTQGAWSVICAGLAEKASISQTIREYKKQFGFAKVSGIEEYKKQTFGQTLLSVKIASYIGIFAAMALTFLVTLLFMKLLTAKDRYSIGVIRALGFTKADIKKQYIWRSVFILTAGVIIGTVLAGTLGEKLASVVIASFGAEKFRFTVNPGAVYLFSPLLLLAAALSAAVSGTAKAGNVKIWESVRE